MKAKFIILTPVYNDWKNLRKLMTKINKLFLYKIKQKFDLIIVDDCSLDKITTPFETGAPYSFKIFLA